MSGKENRYHVRAYRHGDEGEIVRLFNLAYEDYVGFVPRTVNYWLWCCRMRPDVDDDGILVVQKDGSNQIVGYAVVGESGNVWEFCVDPHSDKKYIATALLDSATNYLAERGTDRIILNVPSEDRVITEAIEQKSFTDFPVEKMFLSVLDFEALVVLLAQNCVGKLKNSREIFSFRLENTQSWTNPRFSIRTENGRVSSISYTESDCIIVEIDAIALTSILIGNAKPFKSLLQRRLKVRPIRKAYKALKFLSLIKTRDPWFHSRADFG